MRAITGYSALYRLARLATQMILSCAAGLPLASYAQTATALNVQAVFTHVRQLNELTEANMWTDGTTRLRELQRNATSVQLQSEDRTKSYLIDFSRKAVFTDLNGASPPDPIVRTGTASGFTVAYLKLLAVTQGGQPFAEVTAEEIRKDGISQGWRITPAFRPIPWGSPAFSQSDLSYIDGWRKAYGTAFTASPGSVTRTATHITLPLSPDPAQAKARIDVTVRHGTLHTWADYVAPVTGRNVGGITLSMTESSSTLNYEMKNELVTLVQNSPTKWRFAVSGRPDLGSNWTELARTIDYIDMRPDQGSQVYRFWMNGQVQAKQAGAADSTYQTYPASWLSLVNASAQWEGQVGAVWENPPPGVSPGFQLVNKTDFPVLVTLEQVGCLYYGIVPPGQVFQRDTGAVWFTIKAAMAPNIQPPTNWDCVKDPALYAGTVLFAGATAGAGLGVPVMVFTALGLGASYGIEAAVLASGGTIAEGEAARRAVAFVTSTGVTVGYGMLQPRSAGLVEEMAKSAAWHVNRTYAAHVDAQLANQAQLDAINKDLVQEAAVYGAYAGYPWPWKMKDRVMPRYDIVGGPRMRKLEDGTAVVLKQERPLTLLRVN